MASAASPVQPDSHTSSPALAPSRRKANSGGTAPITVMQRLRGPRVVSPPIRSTPKASASVKNPCANCASQVSSASGNASAKVA